MITTSDIEVILSNKRNADALVLLLMRLSRPDLYGKDIISKYHS